MSEDDPRIRLRRPNPDVWHYSGYPAIGVPSVERTFMGLDLSLTATGLACVNSGRLFPVTLSPGKLRGAERLAWFRDRIAYELDIHKPERVAVEGYAFGAKMKREAMGELGGVIRLALHDAGVPYTIIQPTGLKLFVTGRGNGPKDNMSKEIYKRFGVDLTDNNQIDAAGLAIMAMAMNVEMPLTEFQKRALGKTDDAPGCTDP